MSSDQDRIYRLSHAIIEHFNNTRPLEPLIPFKPGDFKWDGFRLSAGNSATPPTDSYPQQHLPEAFRAWAMKDAEEAALVVSKITNHAHTADDIRGVLPDPDGEVFIWLMPTYQRVT